MSEDRKAKMDNIHLTRNLIVGAARDGFLPNCSIGPFLDDLDEAMGKLKWEQQLNNARRSHAKQEPEAG